MKIIVILFNNNNNNNNILLHQEVYIFSVLTNMNKNNS